MAKVNAPIFSLNGGEVGEEALDFLLREAAEAKADGTLRPL